MALTKVRTGGLTDDAVTTDKLYTPNLGRRNLIINGAMQVAQRGTSQAMAHDGTTSAYLVDRYQLNISGPHEQLDGTYAQVAEHPTSANGKSLKWTTGTAESSYDADEYVYITQKIEAQNLQHLQYGNSNAEAITISFYVRSSITGTFALGLYKPDTTTRIFNKTYAISSANTWEKKTLTFVGDTDSGAGIVNDNGQGLWVSWHLAAGSDATGGGSNGAWKNYGGLTDWADGQATNAVMTTASATWQMTECQVEVGEQATPFEHRSYGEELALCQRYLHCISGGGHPSPTDGAYARHIMFGQDVNGTRWFPDFPVRMRAIPTLIQNNISSSTIQFFNYDTQGGATLSSIALTESSRQHAQVAFAFSAGVAVGQVVSWRWINQPNASFEFEAEL